MIASKAMETAQAADFLLATTDSVPYKIAKKSTSTNWNSRVYQEKKRVRSNLGKEDKMKLMI